MEGTAEADILNRFENIKCFQHENEFNFMCPNCSERFEDNLEIDFS